MDECALPRNCLSFQGKKKKKKKNIYSNRWIGMLQTKVTLINLFFMALHFVIYRILCLSDLILSSVELNYIRIIQSILN